MNWRDPAVELPKSGQVVWIMIQPHKDRGSLLKSAMSIQIVCGQTLISKEGSAAWVSNLDGLGQGNLMWVLRDTDEGESGYLERAIAWMPVEEMVMPNV